MKEEDPIDVAISCLSHGSSTSVRHAKELGYLRFLDPSFPWVWSDQFGRQQRTQVVDPFALRVWRYAWIRKKLQNILLGPSVSQYLAR